VSQAAFPSGSVSLSGERRDQRRFARLKASLYGSVVLRLTWRQAAAWRVRRHHLDRRARAGSLLAVASRLCGLHAQVLSSAELSAWARVEGLDRGAVQRALWDERTLVKTWAMRGTLHLLPADELPLWQAALSISPRYRRPAAWKKYFGITLEELDRLTEAVAAALEGRVMTREELMREVSRRTGSPALGAKLAQSSWGTILKPAAFAGGLCFGPGVGQRVRFTRPDTWLGTAGPRVDPQVAAVAVTRRYLAVHGPATVQDLARWWSGGGVSTARQWITALGEEVRAIDLDGTQAWMLAAHVREAREHARARLVRLLPAFDQYVVAASCHAEHLLPGGVLRSRVYRPQGWISPVLLVNGRMEGTWRHDIKGSRVDVVVQPFARVPVWIRRAAGQEAERLAAFLGASLGFTWKS
jgi:Winged helix DNA-binding domain